MLSLWRRKVACLSAATVAAALGVAGSALSNWEAGTRRPSRATIRALDEVYGAKGALADFTWALTTPAALAPVRRWRHNFVPAGGPVWAWMRPAGDVGRLDACIRWGPLGISVRHACDHRGVVIALPVSVSSPPAIAELRTPGWVDFGHGHIPEVLGVPVVAATSRLEVFSPSDHSLRLFADAVGRYSGKALSELLADLPLFGVHRSPTAPQGPAGSLRAVPPVPGGASGVSGARLRRVRVARRLSQSEAATAASALLARSPVSDDQIRVAEAGGTPRALMLAARLDVVYQARGTVTDQRLDLHPGPDGYSVEVPQWWDGPIWAAFSAPEGQADATVTLHWAPWKRVLRAQAGATVTFSATPGNHNTLWVAVPPGWRPNVGLGDQPLAQPIDDGWQPVDLGAHAVLIRRYLPLYLQLAGLSPAELLRLLSVDPST